MDDKVIPEGWKISVSYGDDVTIVYKNYSLLKGKLFYRKNGLYGLSIEKYPDAHSGLAKSYIRRVAKEWLREKNEKIVAERREIEESILNSIPSRYRNVRLESIISAFEQLWKAIKGETLKSKDIL